MDYPISTFLIIFALPYLVLLIAVCIGIKYWYLDREGKHR